MAKYLKKNKDISLKIKEKRNAEIGFYAILGIEKLKVLKYLQSVWCQNSSGVEQLSRKE